MNHWKVHLKLVFVAAVWGFGWPAGRVLADQMAPFTAAWIRYVVAVGCFALYLQATDNWLFPTRGEWKRVAMIGFFSTVVYQAFFLYGMKYTAAGDASLMITFNPFFTALLAILFLNERLHWRLATGLTLGILGVTILFLYSPNVDIPLDERALGDLLIAAAAFAWACNNILMKRAMNTPAPDAKATLSPLHLTVWSSVAGLILLTPPAVIETLSVGVPDSNMDGWISLVFLAVFSTVISYVWFADGIRTIGAGKAALYVYLVPPFGIFSGWLLLDEKLGVPLLLSFVLIVGGVWLAQSQKAAGEEAS
ncbi:MAG: DMT family transporter [Candidatus Poseidoniaceae archaeon]|nr:DMT family transporter [Candidatus Poseidoniaceae archaeon]MDG1558539.1 DMT family transporter [Candidatus Poseidoniaceae archaeon]